MLVVLIFLNAVFASAEIAVISMNETRLARLVEEKNKQAVRLKALTRQPARFLATIQVAITLAGLLSSAVAAENFADPVVAWLLRLGVSAPEGLLHSGILLAITLILAYFNLVFGELVPKRIAMKKADAMALGMSGLLSMVSRIFAPLVALLTVSTNGILRLLGFDTEVGEEKLSEEEIRMILLRGNEQGVLGAETSEFIQNVFEFDDISVEQICAHRVDVVMLNAEDGLEQWDKAIFSHRFNYFPVYRDYKDNVIGVLDAKGYLRMQDRTKERVMEELLREPYFIPSDMKADKLLQNMRQKKEYFAVLLDEYGGMAGVITSKDLIEELVGDFYETGEVLPEKISRISENRWKIRGDAPLDEVAEALGRELPTDQYDTFNGLIYGITGTVPRDGEGFSCEGCGMRIQVHTVEAHRVREATVELLKEKGSEDYSE